MVSCSRREDEGRCAARHESDAPDYSWCHRVCKVTKSPILGIGGSLLGDSMWAGVLPHHSKGHSLSPGEVTVQRTQLWPGPAPRAKLSQNSAVLWALRAMLSLPGQDRTPCSQPALCITPWYRHRCHGNQTGSSFGTPVLPPAPSSIPQLPVPPVTVSPHACEHWGLPQAMISSHCQLQALSTA